MSKNNKNDRDIFLRDDEQRMMDDLYEQVDFSVFMGKTGRSFKVIIFKKEDFKKELAPRNATIEEFKMDGQSYIRMHY